VAGRPAVVVVGATGIFRPAVRTLVTRGRSVLAIARDPARLAALTQELGPLVSTAAADTRQPQVLARTLASGRWTGALAYAPAMSDGGWVDLSEAVDGPIVQVWTSGVAAPGAGEPSDSDSSAHGARFDLSRLGPMAPHSVRLVLGWTTGGRWHTPSEVSAAVIATLDAAEAHQGATSVLGQLRPWSARPS
jgi:hypothetical protein